MGNIYIYVCVLDDTCICSKKKFNIYTFTHIIHTEWSLETKFNKLYNAVVLLLRGRICNKLVLLIPGPCWLKVRKAHDETALSSIFSHRQKSSAYLYIMVFSKFVNFSFEI